MSQKETKENFISSHTKTISELRFTIIAKVHEYHVDFIIYDIEGWAGDNDEIPLWHKAGESCHLVTVDKIDDAEPYIHGEIKWDGCSNWHFDEQDRSMIHGCERNDLQRLGDILVVCWDWMPELCQRWDYLDGLP